MLTYISGVITAEKETNEENFGEEARQQSLFIHHHRSFQQWHVCLILYRFYSKNGHTSQRLVEPDHRVSGPSGAQRSGSEVWGRVCEVVELQSRPETCDLHSPSHANLNTYDLLSSEIKGIQHLLFSFFYLNLYSADSLSSITTI